MAVRDVVLFPAPVLKQVSVPVDDFGDGLQALVSDLRDTLARCPGVGLAAPQIGVSLRVVLVDVSARFADKAPMVLVNPVIVEQSRWRVVREGCLSVPEFLASVRRADRVRVTARTPGGESLDFVSTGLEAVALQHEIDHLDGILFLDRVASLKTDVFRRRDFGGPERAVESLMQSQGDGAPG